MNKQQIVSALNKMYLSRRNRAQADAFACLTKARSNPDYYQVEREIKSLTFELGKAEAMGTPTKALAAKIAELESKRLALLAAMGLKQQDLEPTYKCDKCQDTGRVGGKLCECYKKELYNILLENSGARTNLANFNQYDETLITNPTQREQFTMLKDKFKKWVAAYPNVGTHTFVFCGATGVGKTFIGECIAQEMISRGHLVSFISAVGLNDNFLKYHTTFDQNKRSFYDMFVEPELLVIDDLGTEPIIKNVTQNYLCALLNDRFAKRKATIITTNLDPNGILTRYGDRIFSRIVNKADGGIIKLTGDDLRLKRRKV